MKTSLENKSGRFAGLLQENETLLRAATIHKAIYWKGLAALFLGLYLLFVVKNLGFFFLAVSAITLLIAFLTKHYLLLVVTDKRIFVRHGIIQLDTIQLHLSRIESIELERTILGRILGYATVLITGTGSRAVAVPFIADAEEFRKDVDKMLFKREDDLNKQ